MAILRAGQRLGGYEVEGLLGTGGMAEVYRATHKTLERTVAIKVINPAFNADPTFSLRFLREAKVVARLSHPHIISVYDFGEEGELAYLVMEIAEGGTLHERAAALRTLAEAVEELAPIADALGYAHTKGIVHRDLKPINLLLTEAQWLLLADFGMARIATQSLDVELDETGLIVGTPYYMAPEQVLAEKVDHRADIYALGILAYELLTGRLPFRGTSATAVMQQHLKTPMPSLRASIPNAPMVLEQAIARATAKQASDRYNSTAEFMADLREAARQAPDMPIGMAIVASAVIAPVDTHAQQPPVLQPATEPEPHVAADLSEPATLVMPSTTVDAAEPAANVPLSVPPQQEPAQLDFGATEFVRPAAPAVQPAVAAHGADQPAGGFGLQPAASIAASNAAGGALRAEAPLIRRVRRRPSSFSQTQWLTIGTVLLVVLFVNVVGLWLTRAGLAANRGNLLEGINQYVYHHLGAFKSALTGLALVLATLAVFSMRAAIIDSREVSPKLYRRLRQYHRLVGYGAIVIALGVGLLTCVGIFGFSTSTPRTIVHSILGTALLVTICAKLAVVRYFPAQRRHLKLLGEGLLVLFLLVFATSTVPYVWSHINGSSSANPYNPYLGRTVR